MKRKIGILGILCVVSIASCATIPVRNNIECRANSNECEVDGAFSAVFKRSSQYSLLHALTESAVTLDAASISLEFASTAIIPSSGLVDIDLIDSTNGSLQASSTFTWVKSGNDLVLASPNAVNTWALNNGGTADTMAYVLHPFVVVPVFGNNSMTVSAQVDGVTTTSASTTWFSSRGGSCRTCQQQ